jgi:hypothetical protein
MSATASCDSTLCYLDASHVQTTAGQLSGVHLRNTDDRLLGRLEGVIIDAAARRVRYYVVESLAWLGRKHFLLPADRPVQVEPDRNTLSLRIDLRDLTQFEEFRRGAIRPFSDDDVMTALFAGGATPG